MGSDPMFRDVCSVWIRTAIEENREIILEKEGIRAVLQPFLTKLSKQISSTGNSGDVLASSGKWQLVAMLASTRRKTIQQAKLGCPRSPSHSVSPEDASEGELVKDNDGDSSINDGDSAI